jgi:AraC-like DNA-binding protein
MQAPDWANPVPESLSTPSPPPPTIRERRDYLTRAASFDGFYAVCAELGLDGAALLRQAGLDPLTLQDPDILIPHRAYARALDLAATASRQPHFGLLLAAKQSLSMLGPVGFLVGEAPDLRSAATQLGTYIHLHNQSSALRLDVAHGVAIWSHESLDPNAPGHALHEDHVLATGMNIFRRFVGHDQHPESVGLPHAAPQNGSVYRRLFGCRVEFAAEQVQIVFDAALLDQPVRGHNPRLHAVLDSYIKHLNAEGAAPPERQIQIVILQAMKSGDSSLQRVAATLAMTPRSLQRRLWESGTNFQAELDAVRSSVARLYLKETQLPLTAISTLLGYSDLTAFSRAFKRMNGVAPQYWRRDKRSS